MVRSVFMFPVLLLLLAALSPVATRSQACFQAGYVDFGLGPIGDDEIYGLWVEGDDIVVELRWSTQAASAAVVMVLSNLAGDTVGSWKMVRNPGFEEKQRLTSALSQVAEQGFQYRLRLEDADGASYDQALRVTVDCPAKELCRYGLRVGLESSAIAVSEALGVALAEAAAADSTDLLADVRAEHPKLAREIPGLAWQMEQARSSSQTGCACEWVTIEDEVSTPPTDTGSYRRHPQFDVHYSIQNLPGPGLRVGAQTHDGRIEIPRADTWGRATLGLRLLCTRIASETTTTYGTEWGSGELEVTEREVAFCPLPCTPMIEHEMVLDGCASGRAKGRDDLTASALASLETTLWLEQDDQDGDVLLADAAVVDLAAAPGQSLSDREGISKLMRNAIRSPAVMTWLETSGSLDLQAHSTAGTLNRSYAFGSLAVEYQMHLTVDPAAQSCALPPAAVHSTYRDDTGTGGGVVIEIWEKP